MKNSKAQPFSAAPVPGEVGMGIGGLSDGLAVVSFPWWEMGLERVKSAPAGSWLAVGNARKKKTKQERKKKTPPNQPYKKYGGRGKKKKKRRGGRGKQEERGENKIKKAEDGKKKGGKKKRGNGV